MSKPTRHEGIAGRRGLAAGALTVSGFAASLLSPAQAVTLGDLSLQSALGEPLSARIPVQLGPGEILGAGCVSVPTATRSDLGALPRPVVTVPEAPGAGRFELRVTTTQPLYEPMYELQVQVRCAGTPLVVRQYVLMLDLPGTAQPAAMAAAAAAGVESSAEPAMAPRATTAAPPPEATAGQRAARGRPHVAPGATIAGGTRYRVAAGDTLSTIAARVGDRHGLGIWQLADRIFAANPQAFIGGNPDLIKLGSEIVIPGPAAGPAVPVPSGVAAPATPVAPQAPAPNPAAAEVAASAPAAAETAPAGPEPGEAVAAAPADDASPAPVFEDEQPASAAAGTAAVAAAPSPAERSGAPPWLAALIGVLVGAAVSLALLRERLVAAVTGLLARKPVIEPVVSAPAPATPAARPPPQFSKPLVAREPSMVVEEHPAEEGGDDPLARTDESVIVEEQPLRADAVAAQADRGDNLASLFGQEPDLPLYEDARDALPSAEELDLDLSAATGDATVDQDIGWLGDETALTPTAEAPALARDARAETAEHIDLQTLSQRAGEDAALSQTLKDALNLLESDYEDELTASQVVDRGKLERMLDAGDADDTLVRTGTDQLPRRR